jgi:hypothetical protein
MRRDPTRYITSRLFSMPAAVDWVPYIIFAHGFHPFQPSLLGPNCTRCHFALVPTGVYAHLRIAHASDVSLASRKTAVEAWKGRRDLSQPRASI